MIAIWFIIFILAVAIGITFFLPPLLEKHFNKVAALPPYPVGDAVRDLHGRLQIVDLHADPLLWKRDLVQRSNVGHVDLPRLIEGNVALQVFAAVTKTPRGMNFESNSSDSDLITLLAMVQAWPPRTWRSLLQRALYQARKLEGFAARSNGVLYIIKSADDIERLLARRASNSATVGGLLALEGVHALEGDLDNLDHLYHAGYRMIGLTHFFDNEAAGSAHGMGKGGLTPFGRQLVQKVLELRMVLDLAHASPRVIDDALEMTNTPIIVSHTGVCGTCESPRNLSNDHVRGIASTGGVIGITMFAEAVGSSEIKDTARAMRYTADLVGVDHVALGTDFDGAVTAPVDATGLPQLTAALLDEGFSEKEITQIMGGNALRVLSEVLPAQ
jgi:microsomal dipeptidase-like Zn-dependent dipeptidase